MLMLNYAVLQRRYPNRPIVEFEIAAQEQMKVTELRLAKLFSTQVKAASISTQNPETAAKKAGGTFVLELLFQFR